MKQKWIGLVLAIIAFVLGMTLPIEGMPQQGTMALFTLIGAVCLWVCGTLPLAISGLGCMLILIVTGVGTANEVVGNFMNTAVLFLIYCFTFGTVFKKTSVSKKVVGAILRLSKGNSKTIVLGFLMISCILSFFMHNLAVIAIMMPIGVEILEILDQEKLKSNIGKGLMIGLPIAAMVGGAGTPIGASMNVLVIGLVESMTGQAINFGQWTVLAAPVALICTWASYFALTRIYKPEKLDEERVQALIADFNALPKLTGREIYTMIILIVSVVLMILGTWVPVLTILNVGLGFLVVATLPGIQLVTWKEIIDDVSWGDIHHVRHRQRARRLASFHGSRRMAFHRALLLRGRSPDHRYFAGIRPHHSSLTRALPCRHCSFGNGLPRLCRSGCGNWRDSRCGCGSYLRIRLWRPVHHSHQPPLHHHDGYWLLRHEAHDSARHLPCSRHGDPDG